MSKRRCGACGSEDWLDKLFFCATDEMWVCTRCSFYIGVVDAKPRCPRCHHELQPGSANAGILEPRV